MPTTPHCFVQSAAQHMAASSLSEADYRSVVSRAYYGAFHCANMFARQTLAIDLDNIKGGKHVVLSSALTSYQCACPETKREIHRAGARLRIFHSLRVRADYFLDDTISQNEASSQIRNSFELIDHLQTITQKMAA